MCCCDKKTGKFPPRVYRNGKKVLDAIWWILAIADAVYWLYWFICMWIIMWPIGDTPAELSYRIAIGLLAFHTINTVTLFSVKLEHEKYYLALVAGFLFALGTDTYSLLDVVRHISHDFGTTYMLLQSTSIWAITISSASIVWFVVFYLFYYYKPYMANSSTINLTSKKRPPEKRGLLESEFNYSAWTYHQPETSPAAHGNSVYKSIVKK